MKTPQRHLWQCARGGVLSARRPHDWPAPMPTSTTEGPIELVPVSVEHIRLRGSVPPWC